MGTSDIAHFPWHQCPGDGEGQLKTLGPTSAVWRPDVGSPMNQHLQERCKVWAGASSTLTSGFWNLYSFLFIWTTGKPVIAADSSERSCWKEVDRPCLFLGAPAMGLIFAPDQTAHLLAPPSFWKVLSTLLARWAHSDPSSA